MILNRICQETELILLPERPENLCGLPYPGHPKGCPNLGKRSICPPAAPTLCGRYILVGVQFNLASWVARMKKEHPAWSDRQARCCLYWQGQVRRELREYIQNLWVLEPKTDHCPEAGGADITQMMETLGHRLQWPPLDFVWKIALVRLETGA
ncbi:hypothetical protein LCGC14_1435950 [marine sediment metagenome]|uniref:Uncharacterized protein n=1 Tax=marine sediment metagenome TaxID=412755 RepID=A0A0F9JMP6_9ZZZZ